MVTSGAIAVLGEVAALIGECGSGDDGDVASPPDCGENGVAVECTENRIRGSVAIYDSLFGHDPEPGEVGGFGVAVTNYPGPEIAQQVEADQDLEIVNVIQEIWNETIPSVSGTTLEEHIVWNDNLKGLQPTADSTVFFDGTYLDA